MSEDRRTRRDGPAMLIGFLEMASGVPASAALIALQVIRVVVPGLQFDFYCPVFFGFGWILDGPAAGSAVVQGFGVSFWLARAPSVPQSCIAINAVALVAVVYLLVRIRRIVPGGSSKGLP